MNRVRSEDSRGSERKPIIQQTIQAKAVLRILAFAVAKVLEASPWMAAGVAVLSFVMGVMPAVAVYVGKLLLDAVVDLLRDGATPEEAMYLGRVLALQLAVGIGSQLLTRGKSCLSYSLGQRLSLLMQTQLLQKASTLDYGFYDDSRFYDVSVRARSEVQHRPLTIVNSLVVTAQCCIACVSMAALLLTFSVSLCVGMILACIPLLVCQLKYGRREYLLQYGRTEDLRMAAYAYGGMWDRMYMAEIMSFGLYPYLFGKWRRASERFMQQDITLFKRRNIAELFSVIVMRASIVAATGYIVYASAAKAVSITVGGVMMYVRAFTDAMTHLQAAVEQMSRMEQDILFLQNLMEFHELQPRIEAGQAGKEVPPAVETIAFENVSFKYPNSARYALKGINLTFRRSESTLILGENGSGKTTLIKLLIRLYDPCEGRILVNGVDIKEFRLESLRKAIGVIFQEFVRHAFSAHENIGCGRIDDIDDRDRVVRAARRAKAHSFIELWPRQYDTILSKLFKDGEEISLGQWQRICLARLFMKDSPVLILDEPTASLDIATEAHILQELREMAANKVCVLVSHRTIRTGIADRIVVLSDGRIVETGSYESLLTRNGAFAKLWKLYNNTEDKMVPEVRQQERQQVRESSYLAG